MSDLEGELFKADVTCYNEYGDGKLFFKHNGTRNLLEKGRQLNSYVNIVFTAGFLWYRPKTMSHSLAVDLHILCTSQISDKLYM